MAEEDVVLIRLGLNHDVSSKQHAKTSAGSTIFRRPSQPRAFCFVYQSTNITLSTVYEMHQNQRRWHCPALADAAKSSNVAVC